MKYAVIADIHANLPALEAVLSDIKAQECGRIVCLGDLVGYYNNPKECVKIIRDMQIPCVKGNHDEYCSNESTLTDFNTAVADVIRWTRAQLDEDDRQWLRNLKYIETVDSFTIVHATLDEPQRWGYVFDKLAAAMSFSRQTATLCFFGHTHVPVAFIRNTMVRGGTYSKFKVEKGNQYFINPGSVGQPRDNNPKAAYAVYDSNTTIIELRRIAYLNPGSAGGSATVPKPFLPVNGPTQPTDQNSASNRN